MERHPTNKRRIWLLAAILLAVGVGLLGQYACRAPAWVSLVGPGMTMEELTSHLGAHRGAGYSSTERTYSWFRNGYAIHATFVGPPVFREEGSNLIVTYDGPAGASKVAVQKVSLFTVLSSDASWSECLDFVVGYLR